MTSGANRKRPSADMIWGAFLILTPLLLFMFSAQPALTKASPAEANPVAATIPEPVGDIYVQDFENILSAQQVQEIRALGHTLEDQTRAQIAILTVPSLEGYSIETYALEALRSYKLGDAELNNGVLLLLSMGESQVRIEVGYGLEGALPDGKTGRILDQVTIPYLQNGQPDTALLETYRLLASEVAQEYGITDMVSPQEIHLPEGNTAQNEGGMSIFWMIGIVVLIVVDVIFFRGTFTMLLLSMLGRRGGGPGGGGGGFRGGGGGSGGGGGASRRF